MLTNLKPIMTIDFLTDALDDGKVAVVFIKKNGDSRLMLCTTNVDYIPDKDIPDSWPHNYGELFTVYDLVKGAWRSFHFDRLVQVML